MALERHRSWVLACCSFWPEVFFSPAAG